MIEWKAAAIGERAGRILAAGGSARVIGLTSRGVFLVNRAGEIIFISFEDWHGPLTINLAGGGFLPRDQVSPSIRHDLSDIQMGSAADLQAGRIWFPEAEISISTGHLTGWMAIEPSHTIEAGILVRLRAVAEEWVESGAAKGWNRLLLGWTGLSEGSNLAEPLVEINRGLAEFKSAVSAGDEDSAAEKLGQLLGKGEGLTPSGDDLVVGLLLVARRYPQGCPHLLANPAWVQRILGLARQKTTWLGACLVESAAEGQADERLVMGLDGIVTGKPGLAEIAERLRTYGSSSGSDVLLGMALALQ